MKKIILLVSLLIIGVITSGFQVSAAVNEFEDDGGSLEMKYVISHHHSWHTMYEETMFANEYGPLTLEEDTINYANSPLESADYCSLLGFQYDTIGEIKKGRFIGKYYTYNNTRRHDFTVGDFFYEFKHGLNIFSEEDDYHKKYEIYSECQDWRTENNRYNLDISNNDNVYYRYIDQPLQPLDFRQEVETYYIPVEQARDYILSQLNQVSNDIRFNNSSNISIGIGSVGVGVYLWGVVTKTALATPIGGIMTVLSLIHSISADMYEDMLYEAQDGFIDILSFIDNEQNNGKYIEITKETFSGQSTRDITVTINTYSKNYIEKTWIHSSGVAYFGEFGVDNTIDMSGFFNIAIDGVNILS
jgi:hypothetical protein